MKLIRLLLLLALCAVPAHAQSIFDYRISGVYTGTAIKAPVVVATTAGITLSGAQTIDGVAVTDHLNDTTGLPPDRVLVKNQADQTTNGIYNVNSSGAWTRASDFNGPNNAVNGTMIVVAGGNTQSGLWLLSAANPVVIASDTTGASNLVFGPFFNSSAQTLLGVISKTQGVILYYNGTAWVALPPGTTGQYLESQGASANPLWNSLGSYLSNSGGPGSISTMTPLNIVAITLSAGDWDVGGYCDFVGASGTVTSYTACGVNSVSATVANQNILPFSSTAAEVRFSPPTTRFNLSVTTTIYLIGYAVFANSTETVSGFIWARKVG